MLLHPMTETPRGATVDKRIKTFLQAAQTGGSSEANRRWPITQSAATQQMASPDDEAGARLLNRESALPERTQKKALRRAQMRRARASLSASERARQSAEACGRLLALPEAREARVVACYLAFGDELDVGEFMRCMLAAGRAVALPVTLRGPHLAFVRVGTAELDDPALLPGCLREPQRPLDALPAELEGRLVAPADIDVAVLPGLAFDAQGTRLGYGGGYYDAWLGEAFGEADAPGTPTRAQGQAQGRPLLVGVGFDFQLLPPEASLPREAHDVPLDVVVTPGGTLVVAAQASKG